MLPLVLHGLFQPIVVAQAPGRTVTVNVMVDVEPEAARGAFHTFARNGGVHVAVRYRVVYRKGALSPGNGEAEAAVPESGLQGSLGAEQGLPHKAPAKLVDSRLIVTLELVEGVEYCFWAEVENVRARMSSAENCRVASVSPHEIHLTIKLLRFVVTAERPDPLPFRAYFDRSQTPLAESRARGDAAGLRTRCLGQSAVALPDCGPAGGQSGEPLGRPILIPAETEFVLAFVYWDSGFSLVVEDAGEFPVIQTNDWSTFRRRSTEPIKMLPRLCHAVAAAGTIFQRVELSWKDRSCQ